MRTVFEGPMLVNTVPTRFRLPFRSVPCAGARCISPEAWIDVSGSSARDVARQLREQQLMMPGYRDSDLPKASREQLQISFRNV